MSSSLMIRRARRKDRSKMKECNERNLKENYKIEFWEKPLLNYPWKSFVLVDGDKKEEDKIHGYLFADENFIISFAIDEKYRGQGWGKKLLTTFLQESNKDPSTMTFGPCPLIRLHVKCSNETAINLYKKCGFTIAGSIPDYYQNPVENAYLMIYDRSNIM